MRTTPAGWYAQTSSPVQDTIYVLSLPTLGLYFSTAPVRGLSAAQALIQNRPALPASQFDPLGGSSTIGTMQLELLDQGGAITAIRRSAQFRGQEHEIFEGYRGLPWASYASVLRGRVRAFSRTSLATGYRLEAVDRWGAADIERFSLASMAAEPYTGATKSFDGGSLVLEDSDGDLVYDRVTLTGNPVTLGLKMLLSGHPTDSTYNVWPAWAGAGLATTEVDVDWWEAERAKISVVPMQPIITDAINVRSYIAEQFARALGGYTTLSNAGQLRIHYPSSPSSTADLMLISDDHIIDIPQWVDSSDYYMSHVRFSLDYDGSDYGTVLPPRASPEYLEGEYDEERVHIIQSQGLRSALGGISIADTVTEALFRRYATPRARIRFSTLYNRHTAEAGDVIRCTASKVPDIDGRGRGGERLFEVLQVRPSVNRVEFDCLDLTDALTGNRVAVIGPPEGAPDELPDYDSATEDQKRYAFIAPDDTGVFADGRGAYAWG